MYALFVSHDCGCSYHKEREAETLDELQPRTAVLDNEWKRWYIEKDGVVDYNAVCAIYRGMIATIAAARSNEAKGS